MMPFTFSYELSGRGWADVRVSAGGSDLTMRVSFLSDALRDLADAVASLFSRHDGEWATCCWEDEPGEYRWLMQRQGDAVRLRIVAFDDCFSRQGDDSGRVLFETDCALLRLATQVRGQMRRVLHEFGEEGYCARWDYPFPAQALERLVGLIEERKRQQSARTPGGSAPRVDREVGGNHKGCPSAAANA